MTRSKHEQYIFTFSLSWHKDYIFLSWTPYVSTGSVGPEPFSGPKECGTYIWISALALIQLQLNPETSVSTYGLPLCAPQLLQAPWSPLSSPAFSAASLCRERSRLSTQLCPRRMEPLLNTWSSRELRGCCILRVRDESLEGRRKNCSVESVGQREERRGFLLLQAACWWMDLFT